MAARCEWLKKPMENCPTQPQRASKEFFVPEKLKDRPWHCSFPEGMRSSAVLQYIIGVIYFNII